MDVSAIVAVNEEQAARAAADGAEPWVPSEQFVKLGRFPRMIPNLGYHEPGGWTKLEDPWFIDKSGMDKSGPALSIDSFHKQWLEYAKEHPSRGYAITEEGQFQVYVSAFEPKKGD